VKDAALPKDEELILDQDFWNFRWENQLTGWDIGKASPALVQYFEQVEDKNLAILIPGCGNAHEAEALIALGFSNITLIDIAPKAVEILNKKFGALPQVKVICADFFDHQGQYDRIVEQTFFCTLPLGRRSQYLHQVKSLLKTNGRLVGLLFDREFEHQGPPYGGKAADYEKLFAKEMEISTLVACYNSIAPRANTELFINFIKTKADETELRKHR
jgi:SAM-dependent methyltransferase